MVKNEDFSISKILILYPPTNLLIWNPIASDKLIKIKSVCYNLSNPLFRLGMDIAEIN
jgi:hypothetical protein